MKTSLMKQLILADFVIRSCDENNYKLIYPAVLKKLLKISKSQYFKSRFSEISIKKILDRISRDEVEGFLSILAASVLIIDWMKANKKARVREL
jgi:hypothetical protein